MRDCKPLLTLDESLERLRWFGQRFRAVVMALSRRQDRKENGSSLNWVPVRILFIRVLYDIGDRKQDPNLENYSKICWSPFFIVLGAVRPEKDQRALRRPSSQCRPHHPR